MILHSKPHLTDRDALAIQNVLTSHMIGHGEMVEKLEERSTRWLKNVGEATATDSGTSAIYLALKKIGCQNGTRVLLPTLVCENVLDAIRAAGGQAVFCDTGSNGILTEEACCSSVLNVDCAIIPHLFGLKINIPTQILKNIPCIEDYAQCIQQEGGGILNGHAGVMSFHPTKCLTSGEGGILLHRKELTPKTEPNGSLELRVMSRMSDIQASLALSQMDQYEWMLMRRKDIANRYIKALSEKLPHEASRLKSLNTMFFRFILQLRGGLKAWEGFFTKRNIVVRRCGDKLLHRTENLPDELFPNAIKFFNSHVSIPIYPALSDDEVSIICSALSELPMDAANSE